MKNVLIVGSHGFLGVYLYNYLKKNNINIFRFPKHTKKKFNIKYLHNFFQNKHFDIVILLTAITNIDICEINKKKAYDINYLFLKNIIDVGLKYNNKIFFIFTSTDQFYSKLKINNENKNSVYNYYAKTKLLLENYLSNKISCILRTNFFGKSMLINRSSITDFIYNNIKKKKKIYLANDLKFSPIYIVTLCKIIYKLCVSKKNITGKFNAGSSRGLSKYNFGIYFIKKLNLDCSLITKTVSTNLSFKAKRPKDMRMKGNKLYKKLHIVQRSLKKEINMALRDYR